MKVELQIDDKFEEERLLIEARQMRPQLTRLLNMAKKLDERQQLTGRRGDQVYLLTTKNIERLVIEDKQLIAKQDHQSYAIAGRLYQIKEVLPDYFLQISQSELINTRLVDHLQLTANGLIKIVMTNGDFTYSSRRYLKAIKEELGL